MARVERKQNYLLGASMLIGQLFLEVTGPMREDYFLYYEESNGAGAHGRGE